MHIKRRSNGSFRQLLLAVVLLPACLHVRAACLEYNDPAVERLSALIGKDPAAAARAAREQIAAATGSAAPAGPRADLAGLYSVLADASSALELDQDSLAAARSGLALTSDPRDRTHINLAYTHGINTYDMAGMQVELRKLEALLARQLPGSMEEACVLIGLGLLQHQAVRDDLSTVSLTRAARLSATPDRRRQRIHAAEGLMYIARNVGDFEQALALNQEVLDWHEARDDAFELAGAYYARAQIQRYSGDHQQALGNFEHARALQAAQGLTQNVAMADMRICGSHLELGNLAAARLHCNSALRMLDPAQSASPRKETLGLLAAIQLREGKPAAALSRLDAVLDRQGEDLLPARVPQLFELRSQAHAALGHYREAMRDQATFLRLYKDQLQSERNMQAAVLRAHLEADRQVERNALLQQELDRNGGRLRSMIYAAIAGGLILLLLVYLLAANRRQARELTRLAETDALTGLPNRRRTAELVQHMIERAAREGTAVTIAIIDIDHFKRINDRFGHGTGDRVLREFARNVRQSLREGDLIGRWGGEEFLAAMPDTELDVASKVMERMRVKLDAMPEHADSPGLRIRVSVGLATCGKTGHGLDHIIEQADIALYQAKHAGRDTLRIAQQSYEAASTGVRKALRGAGMSRRVGVP